MHGTDMILDEQYYPKEIDMRGTHTKIMYVYKTEHWSRQQRKKLETTDESLCTRTYTY